MDEEIDFEERVALPRAWRARLAAGTLSLLVLTTFVLGLRALAPPKQVTVAIGRGKLTCEVADTAAKRSLGLQTKDSLPADTGMLFVNDRSEPTTMAMKGVGFPIDVVFVGNDGDVLKVRSLSPGDKKLYGSGRPVLYVVETNAGWAASNKISAGARVTFPDGGP